MAKGYAFLVGLKNVDSLKYGGWDGSNGCWGCELDVDNLERLLKPLGFQITVLKTVQATYANRKAPGVASRLRINVRHTD